jgi:hypothetical protein
VCVAKAFVTEIAVFPGNTHVTNIAVTPLAYVAISAYRAVAVIAADATGWTVCQLASVALGSVGQKEGAAATVGILEDAFVLKTIRALTNSKIHRNA